MGSLKYVIQTMLLFIIVLVLSTSRVYAQDVNSTDLIEKAQEFDGKEVTYTGEVIGDIMKRGSYAWINVFDGNNAVGIWAPLEETRKVSYTGSYNYKGDTVKVIGVFNRACPEHGGDFDIHTDTVQVLEKGNKVIRSVEASKKYTAVGLLVVSVILVFVMMKRYV